MGGGSGPELEPLRKAILDTPVVVDASENRLVDARSRLPGRVYPIIGTSAVAADFADRSLAGQAFFRDNSAWKAS